MLLLPAHVSYPCLICKTNMIREGNILRCPNHTYLIHIDEYENIEELNKEVSRKLFYDLYYDRINAKLQDARH